MSCESCPDGVTFTLRDIVQAELDKVRAIKSLSNVVSRALQDVADLAITTIDVALDAIPVLPGLDFTELFEYLTCPLTPLALAVDFDGTFAQLDPTVQLQRFKSLGKALLNKARRDYELLLKTSDYHQVINLARKYANEFTRMKFDAVSFAKAIVISATVLAVCGEGEYTEGPYQDFANEITNFSLTGGIPSDIDGNVAALLQRLIEAEVRFKASALALI